MAAGVVGGADEYAPLQAPCQRSNIKIKVEVPGGVQAEGGGGGCVRISFSSLMSDGICICSCGKVSIPTEKMQKKI